MDNKILIFLIALLSSCGLIISQDQDKKGVIAKVGEAYLYDDDIIYNSSLGDSTVIYNSQINAWITKQLILNSAFQNENVMSQIERKVEDYKESLMLFEFEKYLYANSMDIKISLPKKELAPMEIILLLHLLLMKILNNKERISNF